MQVESGNIECKNAKLPIHRCTSWSRLVARTNVTSDTRQLKQQSSGAACVDEKPLPCASYFKFQSTLTEKKRNFWLQIPVKDALWRPPCRSLLSDWREMCRRAIHKRIITEMRPECSPPSENSAAGNQNSCADSPPGG